MEVEMLISVGETLIMLGLSAFALMMVGLAGAYYRTNRDKLEKR